VASQLELGFKLGVSRSIFTIQNDVDLTGLSIVVDHVLSSLPFVSIEFSRRNRIICQPNPGTSAVFAVDVDLCPNISEVVYKIDALVSGEPFFGHANLHLFKVEASSPMDLVLVTSRERNRPAFTWILFDAVLKLAIVTVVGKVLSTVKVTTILLEEIVVVKGGITVHASE